MSRCFVALRPPPEVIAAVAAVCGDEVDGVRWLPHEQLHVTLRFFPSVDPDALVEAVGAVRHAAVEVVGGPSVQAMFGHVVALPITGADGLAAAVRDATTHLLDDDRPFRGHLTVGRFRRGQRPDVEPRPCVVEWRAESLVVVESRPTEGRHVHTTLAEVALTEPGA